MMPTRLPHYASGMHCGVTGGGHVIAYYNIANTNLIPGHLAGAWWNGSWVWNQQTQAIVNMFSALHASMGGGNGVTFHQYMGGIGNFTVAQGYSMAFDTHRAGSNSLLPSFFTTIQNGKPISLFFDGYNTSSEINVHGADQIAITQYTGTHIMIAFGYRVISYFDSNNVMFRQDTYLHVSSGLSAGNTTMRINSHCNLHHAISTHIN
jgi:hypothetical protein